LKKHAEELDQKLKEEVDRLEQEKSVLITTHSDAVEKLNEEHAQAMEAYKIQMQDEHDKLEPIKKATLELEQKIKAKEEENAKAIEALKEEHGKEIRFLKADHNSQLGDIRSEIQV
jgi:hypothetical protein